MHKRTKALAIAPEVKRKVRERDGGCCILCGSPKGEPCAHYISRAQGGLGIEENVLTLCWACHMRYDQTTEHRALQAFFRRYLQSRYPGWDESKLIYRKEY